MSTERTDRPVAADLGMQGRTGRMSSTPFLAVSVACLLTVVFAASPAKQSAVSGSTAAVPPPIVAQSAPAPRPMPETGPRFAVRRGALGDLDGVDGRLGWNGVHAGMERSAVAARLGGTLSPAIPHPAGWCDEHESRLTLPEGELILAFDGPGEQALLRSITVVLPEAEAAAVELNEPSPVFRTASGELVALESGVGVTFGDVCLG